MIHLKTKFLDCDCDLVTGRHLGGAPSLMLFDNQGKHLITLSDGHPGKVNLPYKPVETRQAPDGHFYFRSEEFAPQSVGIAKALVDLGVLEPVPADTYGFCTRRPLYKVIIPTITEDSL